MMNCVKCGKKYNREGDKYKLNGIIDIESIEDDTETHPWIKEKKC